MKPFFSYFGSKYRLCQKGFYPEPKKNNIVIEPFAGSATYSTYYEPKYAILIDSNPTVVSVWNYLINASENDIINLPNLHTISNRIGMPLNTDEQFASLPLGAQNLIGFWVRKAGACPASNISGWFSKYYKEKSCMVWNDYVKERIVKQTPKIKEWKIIQANYKHSIKFNHLKQTIFIDPPYSGSGGRKYKFNKIDYKDLYKWTNFISKSKHQIIACENEDLSYKWADFNYTAETPAMRGKKQELAWVSGN